MGNLEILKSSVVLVLTVRILLCEFLGTKCFVTCNGWILLASNGYFMGSRLAASTSNYVHQERATPNYLHEERAAPSVYQVDISC